MNKARVVNRRERLSAKRSPASAVPPLDRSGQKTLGTRLAYRRACMVGPIRNHRLDARRRIRDTAIFRLRRWIVPPGIRAAQNPEQDGDQNRPKAVVGDGMLS